LCEPFFIPLAQLVRFFLSPLRFCLLSCPVLRHLRGHHLVVLLGALLGHESLLFELRALSDHLISVLLFFQALLLPLCLNLAQVFLVLLEDHRIPLAALAWLARRDGQR
jgi:hypothetical protein